MDALCISRAENAVRARHAANYQAPYQDDAASGYVTCD